LTPAQKQDVLRFVQTVKTGSFAFRDLVRHLDLGSEERRSLERHLDELDARGVIHKVRRGRYSTSRNESLVSGVLVCHRDGYGFVTPDDRAAYRQDIFIPPRNMADAMHGDRVLIKVSTAARPVRRGQRRPRVDATERVEGYVVEVLERKFPSIVGRFYAHPRFPYVVPLDARLLHDIQVHHNHTKEAKDGQVVVAELTVPPGKYQSPSGRIVAVLGFPDEPGIEYKIVQHKFGLPVEWSPETRSQVAGIADHVLEDEIAGREDFRAEPSVTIDGESARDFDDAVTLRKLPSGNYLLGVHIADVSHYVPESTPLDSDAYARGTSVYFPDRAIPMLPEELSSGICSLLPRRDRLVYSVLMEIDRQGEVAHARCAEGVLHSRARMTYTSVAKILVDRDPEERGRYSELVPLFELMEELCRILMAKRERRGSVDFDLPEPEIRFDAGGKIIEVVAAERNIAHRIIEEFMLAANETVARELSASGGPALYRVHEEPDPHKVAEFAEFALSLGYSLRGRAGRYRPHDFQKFVQQLEGKPEGKFLAYLMLRSFMQARYSEQNLGHFGLAAAEYTHFTSPIRRYPDLVVHRLLKESLKREPSRAWQEAMFERLPEIALHTSARERIADEAEREIEKMKKVQFMAEKVGDEFDAIVFSVTRQGFFVELLDHYVEGFVPAATLTDDRYTYKEKTHSFVGDRNRMHLRLGTRVRVRLDMADRENHRLAFSVVGRI
jgi:ribonuclease R